MFVKSEIRKITIAFEKTHYHKVYLELGRAGLIHLARFEEQALQADANLQKEEALTREIIQATSYALNALHLQPPGETGEVWLVDAAKDYPFAAVVKKKLERAARLAGKIREKREKLACELLYAQALTDMGVDAALLRKSRILKTVFGTVENAEAKAPAYERFMITRSGHFVFGLTMPAFAADMFQYLKEAGFADLSGEAPDASPALLQKRAEALERRDAAVARCVSRLKEEEGRKLASMNADYNAYDALLKAMRLSAFSRRAMFITGWMEAREKPKLIEILRSVCGNRFIINDQKDPDAPVRLRNMRILKPFELLVKTMGMPSGNELDPTPLTAITYPLMFGLMFGDVGQGFVLMLCGLILRRFGQKKAREELVQAGGILLACGGSAAVCGLLYGSVFSSEHILPALWFHPTAEIMRLFFITIMMGVVFIMVGLVLNIINSLINADYAEALLEKRGLAILILYIALVYFAVDYQGSGRFPTIRTIAIFVGIPLGVFSLRAPLGVLFFEKVKPHSLSEYVIETIMEIVEMALGLFANTISFIRVGAFALSHAGLSIVTYTLAGMADPALKSAGAVIVIICGNIFIIGFEGLICGIQSMRLEYYEFFSKFFKGDGVAFSPFTLKTKASEV